MRFVIGTNAVSAHFNNDQRIVSFLEQAEQIIVPAIVVGELKGGYRHGSKYLENERILNDFLDAPIVGIANIDTEVATIYGELYAYLRKNGTPIPQNDIWIAAVAVAVGLPLLTLNDDFDRLPQVRRIAAG